MHFTTLHMQLVRRRRKTLKNAAVEKSQLKPNTLLPPAAAEQGGVDRATTVVRVKEPPSTCWPSGNLALRPLVPAEALGHLRAGGRRLSVADMRLQVLGRWLCGQRQRCLRRRGRPRAAQRRRDMGWRVTLFADQLARLLERRLCPPPRGSKLLLHARVRARHRRLLQCALRKLLPLFTPLRDQRLGARIDLAHRVSGSLVY